MNKEEVKLEIERKLTDMGCENVTFNGNDDNLLIALFDCKEVTSFKADLPGWIYSGIQLDPTRARQYKIDFTKKV